jgi:hypothetical protein
MGGDPMPETTVIEMLTAIMSRAHVHYSGVAYACGLSPATVRHVLASGRLPSRSNARRSLVDFVTKNASAACRSDLRFV